MVEMMALLTEIGDDADLLLRSDAWLEAERRAKAAELDRVAAELRTIILAQRIKRILTSKNMAAIAASIKSSDSDDGTTVIRIMSLPDASALLSEPQDGSAEAE